MRKEIMGNKKNKLCNTCIYRPSQQDRMGLKMRCDYIGITGHMRGCPVENCTRYKRGRRIVVKRHQFTEGSDA